MSQKVNGNLILAIIAAGFGSGFQHGYHTGVVNLPEQVFRDWQNTTHNTVYGSYFEDEKGKTLGSVLWGISTSIMNIGGTIGGMSTGLAVRKLGPKMALILNNIFVVVACLLMSFVAYGANTIEAFVIGRFIIGINCGLNAGLCPSYLSEISPVALRGAISSVYQLVITISILVAMILGLEFILGNTTNWQILFAIPILVAIFQTIAMLFCSDSPKYLLSVKNDMAKADKALKWLRKSDDIQAEMAIMKSEDDAIKSLPQVTVKDMFKNPVLRAPLIIAVLMMLAQQFSGINAIMFYSTTSFEKGGLTSDNAKYATIVVGTVNVLMTVVSVYLVEVAGRKTLLLIGFGGMAIDTVLIAVALMFSDEHASVPWICIALVVIYIILFAAGAGSIPWFLVAEIFNQAARPTAVSIAVPTNWIANFVVTLTFPPVEGAIKSSVFFIYALLNVVFFIIIWKKVPETKNKTIEEITSLFK